MNSLYSKSTGAIVLAVWVLMQSAVVLHAQSRTLGAGGLALDDGHGHIITILAPPGMNGNYTYTLPTSPGSLITSGYVAMGSAVGQTLLWNGSYWTPSNFMSNTTSGLSITGTLSANGSAGTSGQLLQIDGTGKPVWTTVSGSGSVISVDVSGGTTGLTTTGGPISTAGTITLGGFLAIANGGTGATTQADALNNLLPSQAGNAGLVLQTDGSNVSWASITGTGTVTSVAIVAPSEFIVSNSPVTGAGTLTIAKANQAANTLWAGPVSGMAGQPTFRALVSADIPDNGANTSGNAATATTASNFTGTLSGDVTGSQSATVVSSVGGSSAANVHAAELASNAATDANTPSALVKRDASGNFSAGMISANLNGNATTSTTSTSSLNFTGPLSGDVTGSQTATVVSSVDGSSAANVHAAELAANAATEANTASSLVKRDASGNFSAGTISANLNGNATSSTTSTSSLNFTGTLSGDVSGSQTATVVSSVGGSSAANVHAAELAANAATDANIASTLVKRDASGNFSAGTITAAVNGNVSGTALNVTGTVAIANGGTGMTTSNDALNNLLPPQIGNSGKVLETDGANTSWQFVGGTGTVTSIDISGGLTGLTTSGGPVNSSGTITLAGTLGIGYGGTGSTTQAGAINNLLPSQAGNIGKVLQTDGTNISWQNSSGVGSVTSVGLSMPGEWTVTNSPVTSSGTLTISKTNQSANTVYAGPASGGDGVPVFRALISADIPDNAANTSGNAATATTASNFTGTLSGDVTGSQSATVVSSVGGSSAANVHAAELASNAATDANTPSALVKRDASGNFSAGTISANLNGNSTSSTTSTSSLNFTGSLSGDVTGSQTATVVSSVGGSSAANVHTAELASNAATDANTPSALVKRDASGNFSAGIISANLNGNSTSSNNFNGTLSGDVTGSQTATVVSSVGGSSATNVHAAELASNAATDVNTVSTLVKRDASGNFSAGTISASLSGNATNVTGIVAIANGGTAATTANDALNNLLPSQSDNSGKVLESDGTNTSWQSVSSSGSGWDLSGNSLVGTEFLGSTNAEPLIIETNGTERLRILSGGDIGIGTSTPGQALEVKDGNILLSNSGTAKQLQFQGTGSGVSTFQAGAQDTTSINYTLPASQPSANQVLTATAISGNGVTLGWGNSGAASFVRRTTDTGYASATPGNDNTLFLALAANATYTFEAFLSCSDSNQNGITGTIAFVDSSCTFLKFGVNSSGGATAGPSVANGSGSTAGTVSKVYIENGTLHDQNFIEVKGIVINGSSAGTLHLRCGRASTGFLRVYSNSYLTAVRVQ